MTKIKILLSLMLTLVASHSWANEVYISDQIKIWGRTGPSNEYKVKYQYTSGTKLETLQQNAETGFFEVKDERNRVAWVDAKYITDQLTANHRLINLQASLNQQTTTAEEKIAGLEKRLKELTPFEAMNKELQNQMAQLKTELEQARQKGQMFESGFNSELLFSGAAVVLTGMLLGWLLSKIGGQKRRNGWG